jgi:nicotinate-nucleotide--dimethylbenzimidazole phosphoribosyltransferase
MDGGPAGRRRSVARGVSAYPVSVTGAMAANFTAGGAAINQICKTFDISLKVNQLALEKPTGDITREAGARRIRTSFSPTTTSMRATASPPSVRCAKTSAEA